MKMFTNLNILVIYSQLFVYIFPIYALEEQHIEFKRAFTLGFKDSIGQIGGLDIDLNGKLVVFHRGDRKWSSKYILLSLEIIFKVSRDDLWSVFQ